MELVKIVTVKDKIAVYRDGEPAQNIELIQFNEIGNEIISGIGNFEVGNKTIFIEPDSVIQRIPIFEEYFAPGGKESKSKLSKAGRVRAIKFNFFKKDSSYQIFSYGIAIPYSVFEQYYPEYSNENLTKLLNVSKYVEPIEHGDMSQGAFPPGFYKTDETNIMTLKESMNFPITLVGTKKVDGSSITLFCNLGETGICSRSKLILPTKKVFKGNRLVTFFEKIKQLITGVKIDTSIYVEEKNKDIFTLIGTPYLEHLEEYCLERNINLALRGELCGVASGGSGIKHNPDKNKPAHIQFFAVDDIYQNVTYRLGEETFNTIIDELGEGFERCPVLFEQEFNSYEELIDTCQKFFTEIKKETGDIIEGIVVKTLDSKFSTKIMNLEYDSKK